MKNNTKDIYYINYSFIPKDIIDYLNLDITNNYSYEINKIILELKTYINDHVYGLIK